MISRKVRGTNPFLKRSTSVIVGLPRTVCAFVCGLGVSDTTFVFTLNDAIFIQCHVCTLAMNQPCHATYALWVARVLGLLTFTAEKILGLRLTVYRSNLSSPQAVKNETGHYGTELYTEIAERIIETHNASEPLYLYLAQQGVHSANERDPLQAPPRLLDVSQN